MLKKLKGKTVGRHKIRRNKRVNSKKRTIKQLGRHKIGGAVTLNIPHIIKPNNGGSDSQASLNEITETANKQNNMVKALTGGGGNGDVETGTYRVPTFTNGGDPNSNIPNSNTVLNSLIGTHVAQQVQSEYDKNALIKQSGGKRKSKSKSKSKNRKRKTRKMRNKNK